MANAPQQMDSPRVAQNRGIVAEVFYNYQDALNWLSKWKVDLLANSAGEGSDLV
jgi:hypothetical protein